MGNLNFEKSLLEAVDHGLLSLGENPRKAIYFHLGKSFQLQRESIPKETDEFSQALNTIFGPGAEIIEKYILKELYQRLELNFEEKKGCTFADYVREAKKLVGKIHQEKKENKIKMREVEASVYESKYTRSRR